MEAAILEVLEAFGQQQVEKGLLDKVVRRVVMGEGNLRETMSGQASCLGYGEVVIGDLNYRKRYMEYLRDLEPEAVCGVAERYLVREALSVVEDEVVSAR